MNMSRYATQQLEMSVRKSLRLAAEAEAKALGSNRTHATPAQNFGVSRNRKGFRMDNS